MTATRARRPRRPAVKYRPPLAPGELAHAPNLCLFCDGIRRERLGLPQTGGRPAPPLPEEDP